MANEEVWVICSQHGDLDFGSDETERFDMRQRCPDVPCQKVCYVQKQNSYWLQCRSQFLYNLVRRDRAEDHPIDL